MVFHDKEDKEIFCFFIKKIKDTSYEDKLGLKIIHQPFSSNGARELVGIS
jgi:hypothetical protein